MVITEDLGRKAGRGMIAAEVTFVRSFIGLTILFIMLFSSNDLLLNNGMIMRLLSPLSWYSDARIILLGHFRCQCKTFWLSWLILQMISCVELVLDFRRLILRLEIRSIN